MIADGLRGRASELFMGSSGYSFVLNNPVNNIDPSGDTTIHYSDVNWHSFNTAANDIGLDEVKVTTQKNEAPMFSGGGGGGFGVIGDGRGAGSGGRVAINSVNVSRALAQYGTIADRAEAYGPEVDAAEPDYTLDLMSGELAAALAKGVMKGMAALVVRQGAAKTGAQVESKVFLVTKEGVVLPKGAKIPGGLVENKFRSSDFGEIINGKFQSRVRIDPPTPVNMKGPNVSHFHLDGEKEHIFDILRWPWW